MSTTDRRVSNAARRRALRTIGVTVAAGAIGPAVRATRAQGPQLAPTPRDAEGPFYPRSFPADADADLTRVAGRPGVACGTPLLLAGRVVAIDGAPLAGAMLELWQCDVNGTYHHVGASGPQDDGFQGNGRALADAGGGWAFRTIRPVPCGSRPPHLHFRISHPRARRLTTQLCVKGESAEAGAGTFFARERERLEIALVAAPATRERSRRPARSCWKPRSPGRPRAGRPWTVAKARAMRAEGRAGADATQNL